MLNYSLHFSHGNSTYFLFFFPSSAGAVMTMTFFVGTEDRAGLSFPKLRPKPSKVVLKKYRITANNKSICKKILKF